MRSRSVANIRATVWFRKIYFVKRIVGVVQNEKGRRLATFNLYVSLPLQDLNLRPSD